MDLIPKKGIAYYAGQSWGVNDAWDQMNVTNFSKHRNGQPHTDVDVRADIDWDWKGWFFGWQPCYLAAYLTERASHIQNVLINKDEIKFMGLTSWCQNWVVLST